jgi:hypothetical protein
LEEDAITMVGREMLPSGELVGGGEAGNNVEGGPLENSDGRTVGLAPERLSPAAGELTKLQLGVRLGRSMFREETMSSRSSEMFWSPCCWLCIVAKARLEHDARFKLGHNGEKAKERGSKKGTGQTLYARRTLQVDRRRVSREEEGHTAGCSVVLLERWSKYDGRT